MLKDDTPMISLFFWIAIAVVLYTYLGYPLILWLIGIVKHKPIKKTDVTPRISVIIPVYNEEKAVGEKIENTLASDYPKEAMEIIVVSDCSTDATDSIVSEYISRGIKFLRLPVRKGKTIAQNCAIRQAKGDILIFTDASTRISCDGFKRLVRNFADGTVGCVSSEDHILAVSGNKGEGLYVKYEMFIRRLENKISSLVGVSGSFYAIRKELCSFLPETVTRDFAAPLEIVKQGYRTVNDPEVYGCMGTVISEKDEFKRKVRTIIGGLTVLFYFRELLNPFAYRLFSFQLLSHKLLRWSIPFFLVLILFTSGWLSLQGSSYKVIFLLQIISYILALTGLFPFARRRFKAIRIPWFFIMTNIATFIAWIKYLRGIKISAWEPSRRL